MKNSNNKPLRTSHSGGKKKSSAKSDWSKEDQPQAKRKKTYLQKENSHSSFRDSANSTYVRPRPQERRQSFQQFLEIKFGSEKLHSLVKESQKTIEELLNKNPAKQNQTNLNLPLSEEKLPSSSLRGFALAQFKKQQEIANLEKKEKQVQVAEKDTFYTPNGLLLDSWQKESLDALLEGKHIVVDAPTSAGKTRVIEALLEYKLKEGMQLIYTSPVKSLSNDKYREFTEVYGREKVGINTGDFKENLRAPIILATLETYRNSLLGIEPDMRRKVVVYDEYHYLQDDSRGSAWEESLILTPPGSQLILLSASVPNSEDFASWMTALTGVESKVIRVTKRPVPLEHVVYCKNYGWILASLLNLNKVELQTLVHQANRMYQSQPPFRNKEYYLDHAAGINDALELNLGPLVIYAGRRADVEGFAQAFARFVKAPMSSEFKAKLDARLKNLAGWEYVPQELKRLIARFGIAYHHSGMIPPGRVAIESLLKEGLLRICCGTMGISLGVNFAVRSAYITDTHRPSEGGDTSYSNTEIMQMLGRAGRRGRDAQGFSLWFDVGRFVKQSPKSREVCKSSLKIDPTTILSILGVHKNINYLHEFYEKSFYMRSLGHEPSKKKHSAIDSIVGHLHAIGALDGEVPTTMGNISRYFPQAGGLIIAQWLAEGTITHETFFDYLQAMAAFGAAHFKEVPTTHADMTFLHDLNIHSLIDTYYPYHLFPDHYDEIKNRRIPNSTGEIVFREFNYGAASIVKHWLNPKTTWQELIADHSSKYFSDGDCMNVLFRFATFLQSCARLDELSPAIAAQAKRLWKILMRDPLDARNRMLLEEDEKQEAK